MRKEGLIFFGVFVLVCLNFVSAAGLTPIARWDVVPYQRINFGETLNLGVVAFSKEGIDRVEFLISGQGYSGGIKTATEMSLNPQTGVWEYWVPLSASEFSSDGVINVEAVVYGEDGGMRDKNSFSGGVNLDPGLNTLVLNVNPQMTLMQSEVWVNASGGNDNNPGTRDQPLATIGRAVRNLRDMGNNGNGGIVWLSPGIHNMNSSGSGNVYNDNEWITIKPVVLGRDKTILQTSDKTLSHVKKIKVEGIKIKRMDFGDYAMLFQPPSLFQNVSVWIDNCEIEGLGREVQEQRIMGNVKAYYTNSHIHDTRFPTDMGILARSLNLTQVGEDAFRNMPLIVNCNVDDIDRGNNTARHPDVWQWVYSPEMNEENIIAYNLRASNCTYQGISNNNAIVGGQPSLIGKNIAFVNVHLNCTAGGYWARWTDHLLLWHVSEIGGNFFFQQDYFKPGLQWFWSPVTNLSMKGCIFSKLKNYYNPTYGYVDWSDTENNHYAVPQGFSGDDLYVIAPGKNATNGTIEIDSYGRPLFGSPLIDRLDENLVPIDADGNLRDSMGDIGAYEFISGTQPQGNCMITKAYWRIV